MTKTPETPITFERDESGLFRVSPGPGTLMTDDEIAAYDLLQGTRYGSSSRVGDLQIDELGRPIARGFGEHPLVTKDKNMTKAGIA